MNREKLDIDGFNVRFGDADFWFYWIRFSDVKKLLHQGEKEVVPGSCHSHTAFEIHIITEESASFQIEKKRAVQGVSENGTLYTGTVPCEKGRKMLKEDSFIRKNLFILILLTVTGILITVTGILFRQAFLRILPLYISLFVMLLNSRVSRFGPLVGGINSLLYAVVYLHYGLYASAAYAVLVSCPFQIVTFIRWSKHPYENSTVFRRMTWKQRGLTALAFAAAWLIVCAVLQRLSSNYMLLDTTTSLLGVLISLFIRMPPFSYLFLIALTVASLSATLNFALCERGFSSSSCLVGRIGLRFTRRTCGFLPQTQTGKSRGHSQPLDKSANFCLTMRSSNEWKVMIAILPPSSSSLTAESMAGAITLSSLFTSMRIAWNVLFAGCDPPSRIPAGIALLMM